MPALGPRQAAEVSGTVASQAISPSWVSAPGVARERVWLRDVTADEDWHRLDDILPSEGTFTVDGLENRHVYEVTLQRGRGYFDAADDVRSTPRQLRPLPRALTAPVAGLEVAPTDHGLEVSWTAEPDADGYTVWYRGRGFDVALRSMPAEATTVRLAGLQAGGEYDVWVEASNGSGTGPATAPVTGMPLGPTLTAPRAPALEPVDKGLVARWSPVARARTYWLQFRDVEAPEWWTVVVPGDQLAAELDSLGPGRSYEVRVRAIHQQLIGPLSPTSTATVPSAVPDTDRACSARTGHRG